MSQTKRPSRPTMRRTAPRTSATNQASKVTDFFTRKSAGDPPTALRAKSSLARTSAIRDTSAAAGKLGSEREVISVSSDSHISVSSGSVVFLSRTTKGSKTKPSATAAADSSPPCVKQRTAATTCNPDTSPKLPSAKAAQILKPYIDLQQRPSTPKKPKSTKRKKKIDRDSDVEYLDTAIYVPRAPSSQVVPATPALHVSGSPSPLRTCPSEQDLQGLVRTPPKKKQRLSAPDSRAEDTVDFVPSSQEDEQGLVDPPKSGRKTVDEVEDIVSRWRQATLIPSNEVPHVPDDLFGADTDVYADYPPPAPDLDADMPPAEESRPSSSTFPDVAANGPCMTFFTSCPGTPPREQFDAAQVDSTSSSVLPSTPVALNAESKAAQIIAQIKANAFQARYPSPENEVITEVPDLEDSSDEEEDIFPMNRPPSVTHADRSYRRHFSSPLSSLPTPMKRSPSPPRYSLRSRGAPKHVSAVMKDGIEGAATKRSAYKRVQDMRQASSVTLGSGNSTAKPLQNKRAEDPLDILLKEKKQAEKSGNGIEAFRLAEAAVEDWTNEEAALAAVREGRDLNYSDDDIFGSPAGSASGSFLDPEERERLFGGERGKAIFNILGKDQKKNQSVPAQVAGVFFWEEDWQMCDRLEATSEFRSWTPTVDPHPLIRDLKCAVETDQIAHATLLINSGILASPHSRLAGATMFLLDLALSAHPIADCAFRALLQHLNNGHNAHIPLSVVIHALLRFGTKASVFESVGWAVPRIPEERLTFQARANIVRRLIIILNDAARVHALSQREVPDFLMVLQLLYMDALTCADMRRDLMLAVDAVCQSLDSVDGDVDIEIQICNKLLQFVSTLEPINVVLFLSSFAGGGSPRTRKIARWLAYCMLVKIDHIESGEYGELPSLSSLMDILNSSLELSDGLFSVDNATDYEALGYRVEILSIALSNIDGYVAEEPRTPSVEMTTGHRKGDKIKPLELIKISIEKINNRIVDTRAAHLERSRTKAALQRLALRIYYQRMTALNSRNAQGKNRTLHNWFKH